VLVHPESANVIDPAQTFTAFLISILARPQPRLAGRTPRCVRPTGPFPLVVCWLPGSFGVNGFGPSGSRPLLIYSLACRIIGPQILVIGILSERVTAQIIRNEHKYSIAELTPYFIPSGECEMSVPTRHKTRDDRRRAREKERREQLNVPTQLNAQDDTLTERRRLDFILIAVTAGAVLGLILLARPFYGANDLSRWSTVYSLAERGTYNIDETPYPTTIDRCRLNGHYYSEKPPLLPTLLAGEYLLLKKLSFGRLSFRNSPATVIRAILASINLVPLVIFLGLFSRLLDRLAPDPWIRVYAMAAAGLGTFLTGFSFVLNNHTIAAFSSFFALYPAFMIWCEGRSGWRLFAVAGFFAGFAAVNDYPALAFLVALGAGLAWKAPRQTLIWFLPFALVPLAGHFWTNYLVTGDLLPAYLHRGALIFPGSYWTIDPISGRGVGRGGIDNIYEPWPVYLFHMLVGHHGILSLSPIFIFTLMGVWSSLRSRGSPLRAFAVLAAFLTLVLLVFYTFFAGNRIYGGLCCGLRFFFWLIPLWLLLLPEGLRGKTTHRWFRGMALAFLLISAISVFYCARNPWSRPWIHEYLHYMQWIDY